MDEVLDELILIAALGIGAYFLFRSLANSNGGSILPSAQQIGSDFASGLIDVGNAAATGALNIAGGAASTTLDYVTGPPPSQDWFSSASNFAGNLVQQTAQGLMSVLDPASNLLMLSGGTNLSGASSGTSSNGGGGGW